MAVPIPAQTVPFDVFLTQVEQAAPAVRPALVETFWGRLERTPLLEGDTAAVFLYRGRAQSVGLLGDMNGWGRATPLRRIAGTGLWYRRERFDPKARLEYTFLIDGAGEAAADGAGGQWLRVLDARNPHRVPRGAGLASELVMPGYAYPEVFAPLRGGVPGSFAGLARHRCPAGALRCEHEVLVYTPPGYASDAVARYPTVYFVGGHDYVAFAHVPAVLDWLAERGQTEPLLAVFVDLPDDLPDRGNDPDGGDDDSGGATERGLSDGAAAFLAGELVPFVDARYRTRTEPGDRLVVGNSRGGLAAVSLPVRHPELFGLGYSQSGHHAARNDWLIRLVEEADAPPIRLYVDTGTDAGTDAGTGAKAARAEARPDGLAGITAANRHLRAALAEQGYDFVYAEHPEGHTWGTWRVHLIEALAHFFPSHNR